MKLGSKILIGCIVVLTFLSLSATFYKTVILQDFEVTGVWIEFPTEDSSYVWFVYDNEEYELELETSNYGEILLAVAGEVGLETASLEPEFVEYLESAYAEAEVTGTGEEEITDDEEGGEAELLEEEDASSTDASIEESDPEASVDATEANISSTTSLETVISI